MESVRAVYDAGAAGSTAREFDGSLDTFRAGVRKEHLVQIRNEFQQTFRQHTGKCGYVELNEIRQVAIKDALQRLAQRRMVPPNRKNAKSTQ